MSKAAEFLSNTNSKLGRSIWVFNLPSGDTCPGKTAFCASICYAAKVERIYKNTRVAYQRNLDAVENDPQGTAAAIVAQIKKRGIKTVRIHANGDFYSADYIFFWQDIARACPETLFFGYTRSWRVKGLELPLACLRALSNVRLLASVDPTTPEGPKGWRLARILEKPESKAAKQGAKVPGHVVCLEQVGHVATCEDCRICFSGGMASIAFIQH